MRRLVALLGLLAVLAGCTGTSEEVRPILLVVATEDTVGLMHDAGPLEGSLTWLPESEWTLPDVAIADLAVARFAGPDTNDALVHVVYRDEVEGTDLLQVLDATGIPVEAAEAFVPQEGPLPLGAWVEEAGVLAAGESLCTTAIDVSADGRWLGVLHDPAGCPGAVAGQPAVLLVDLDADTDDADRVVYPPVASLDDVAVPPVFAPAGEGLWHLRAAADLEIVEVELDEDGDAGVVVDLVDLDAREVGGLGLAGGGRLVVAADDAITVVDPGDGEAVVLESESGLTGAVDGEVLPEGVAVVRSATRLVVHRDVGGDDPTYDDVSVFGLVDAVASEDAFVYALAGGEVVVVDLLRFAEDPDERLRIDRRGDHPGAAPAVAIDWVYGAFPEAP